MLRSDADKLLNAPSMGSRKILKFVFCEVVQFVGLCVPLFIIMQRFAVIVELVKTSAQPPGDGGTAYWLIVASTVAYVTSMALLVWVPLKYMVFIKKKSLVGRKEWRPVALVHVVLSTLPCFAFLIASSEVQMNNNIKQDMFMELPVSLVFFSLICMDVMERLRYCYLHDQAAPGSTVPGHPVVNRLNEMGQTRAGVRPETSLGTFTILGPNLQTVETQYRWSPNDYTGPMSFLCVGDNRANVFVESFMFWMDTVEMTRVSGHPQVFYSSWVFPILILSYMSSLRVVVTPHSPLHSTLGVALQDFPFFVVRIGLVTFFGFVTPVLFLLKNLLVCMAFIYFNFIKK